MKRAIHRVASALTLFAISAAFAAAHPATGVVFDNQRRTLYFSDLETVWKVDAAGRLSSFRPAPGGRHTHELALDGAGNLYGGDISYAGGRWFSAFWRMTPEGEFSYLLPPTEGFAPGWGVQRDAAGNVYSVDQDNNRRRETRLLRRTPEGRVELVAGGPYGHADGRGASARFKNVWGLAVLADGTIYLTDAGHLRRVAPDGTVTTLARELGGLAGLAADGRGSAFVADHSSRRVLRVGGDGRAAEVLRADYPWAPAGVALGTDGSVYVLEFGQLLTGALTGSRVRRVAPDDSMRTLATVGAQAQSDGGTPTATQRAVARLERAASAGRGAYLYLALSLAGLALAALAVRLARRRRTRES